MAYMTMTKKQTEIYYSDCEHKIAALEEIMKSKAAKKYPGQSVEVYTTDCILAFELN